MRKRKHIITGTLIGLTMGFLFLTISSLFESDIEPIDRRYKKIMREAKQEAEENNNKHIIIQP